MQFAYSYAGESGVFDDGPQERVALATSGGGADHPFFFSGFLARPRLSAGLLLSVSKVALSRFYTPAAMRDAAIQAADPVVTSDARQLRFESFSGCTGVYARADFFADALGDGFVNTGTTNVDFNPTMRNALARLRDAEAVHLSVGADEVTLSTLRRSVTERKVPLPERWLRGFAEVQLVQTAMVPRFDLDAAGAKRFLSTLARTNRRGEWWAIPSAGGITLAETPTAGAVRIAGLERLRLIADHARYAVALRVWSTESDGTEATAWELDLPATRLTLVLSPAVGRGFSGEGNVLRDVVDDGLVAAAETLRELVNGKDRIYVDEIAERAQMDFEDVRRGLNVLASAGVVGYDLSASHFFHRALPFGPDGLAVLHPRLRNARALGSDAVTFLEQLEGSSVAAVRGHSSTYLVRMTGPHASCTCPWYEKHGATRGPCKHVLAVQLAASISVQ